MLSKVVIKTTSKFFPRLLTSLSVNSLESTVNGDLEIRSLENGTV